MSVAGLSAAPAFWAQTSGAKVNTSRAVARPAIKQHFNLVTSLGEFNYESRSKTPHCNVHGSFTEIETIYRAYQVLLFNRLRT